MFSGLSPVPGRDGTEGVDRCQYFDLKKFFAQCGTVSRVKQHPAARKAFKKGGYETQVDHDYVFELQDAGEERRVYREPGHSSAT